MRHMVPVATTVMAVIAATGLAVAASGAPGTSRAAASAWRGHHATVDAAPTTVSDLPPLPGTSVVAPVTAAPITAVTPSSTAVSPATTTTTTGPPTTVPAGPTTVPVDAETYVTLVDNTGLLTIEVPASWTDVDLRELVDDAQHRLPAITASPDWASFLDTFTTPGVFYSAVVYTADPEPLFERYSFPDGCRDGGRTPYNDGAFSGSEQLWSDCGGTDSAIHVVVASPKTKAYTLVLFVQTASPADELAYQHMLDTFNVDANVPLTTETVPSTSLAPPVETVAPVPAATTTLAPETVASTIPGETPSTGAGRPEDAPAGFRWVTDDSGTLRVQVPDWWTDINGAPAAELGGSVPALSAAPDLDQFHSTFDVPGLTMFETAAGVDEALAQWDMSSRCADGGTQPNPNPAFAGRYQAWLDCDRTPADVYVLAATPLDGRDVTVVVVVQAVSSADLAAVEAAFNSYSVG